MKESGAISTNRSFVLSGPGKESSETEGTLRFIGE